MSPDELVKTIIHPYKKYYSPLHQHFLETDIVYPAYSFVAKPFAWMMKDRMVRSKSEVIIADCLHYQMCRKTPSFSYGDIRHVHRIYASN